MNNLYAGKRLTDITISVAILFVTCPLLLGSLLAVWLQDGHSPFYLARRVGRGNRDFTMVKIRSMRIRADATGVNSTGANDNRVTAVGRFIRKWKIDELSQFLNVVAGTMSIVGPRPNTRSWGTDLYTDEELRLLSVRPGITDLSSIIFSDEGAILADAAHADLEYNRIIRPWKSRLGLFYIDRASLLLDLRIMWLTFLAIVSKPAAIAGVQAILKSGNADLDLTAVCARSAPLYPAPPPGSDEIESGKPRAATT